MEVTQTLRAKVSDKHSVQNGAALTPYHHHVLSSILPDVEREFAHMQSKNKGLERENKALQKKVEHLTPEGALLKVQHQRTQQTIQKRDLLRGQLVQCKDQLVVLGKKIKIQENELRREHKKNEVHKQELESVRKELQLIKKQVTNQRVEHQTLKEQLEQAVKERDSLSDKLVCYQNECLELQEKIGTQQSSLNRKESRCKEETRQVRHLKLEIQRLEREKSFLENEAEEMKREVWKIEEELMSEREKHIKSTAHCSLEKGGRVIILQQKPQANRKPRAEMYPQKSESLQKELLSQTKELRRSQKLGEELKQSLTKLAVQHQQSRAALRNQKEKLKSVTAQRNMYQTEMEKTQKELMAIKKETLGEKLKSWAMKKNKKMKMSSPGAKSGQSLSCSSSSDQPK